MPFTATLFIWDTNQPTARNRLTELSSCWFSDLYPAKSQTCPSPRTLCDVSLLLLTQWSQPAGPDAAGLQKPADTGPHLLSAVRSWSQTANDASAQLVTQRSVCPLWNQRNKPSSECQLQVFRQDSVLVLLKTPSAHLISALWGLRKVLSFKDGPSVQKQFHHSCSAHQLSGVWRGAAALWMYSQIWKYVCGCSRPQTV